MLIAVLAFFAAAGSDLPVVAVDCRVQSGELVCERLIDKLQTYASAYRVLAEKDAEGEAIALRVVLVVERDERGAQLCHLQVKELFVDGAPDRSEVVRCGADRDVERRIALRINGALEVGLDRALAALRERAPRVRVVSAASVPSASAPVPGASSLPRDEPATEPAGPATGPAPLETSRLRFGLGVFGGIAAALSPPHGTLGVSALLDDGRFGGEIGVRWLFAHTLALSVGSLERSALFVDARARWIAWRDDRLAFELALAGAAAVYFYRLTSLPVVVAATGGLGGAARLSIKVYGPLWLAIDAEAIGFFEALQPMSGDVVLFTQSPFFWSAEGGILWRF